MLPLPFFRRTYLVLISLLLSPINFSYANEPITLKNKQEKTDHFQYKSSGPFNTPTYYKRYNFRNEARILNTETLHDDDSVGDYTLTYQATGETGTTLTITRIILQTLDTEAPVITLNGNDTVEILQGSDYNEQGAIAIDNQDGNIDIITTGFVDTTTLGHYTITYTATDQAGNSTTATRTISVIEAISEIIITNPKLQACLEDQIGHAPSEAELQQLTSLECANKELTNSDIIELSQFTALKKLGLSNNQISDISPLSSLTQLTTLSLAAHEWNASSSSPGGHGNQISDLSPLSSLTQLTTLWLARNQISDLSPLSSLTQLTILTLFDNQISDLSPLSSLTQLTILSLAGNQISDIDPLSSFTQLTLLVLSENQISDISSLSTLIQLQSLHLSHNQISDISPLSFLTQLQKLSIDANQISDISRLSSLRQLQELWLWNNCITDFSPISFVSSVTGKDNQNACQLIIDSCLDVSNRRSPEESVFDNDFH